MTGQLNAKSTADEVLAGASLQAQRAISIGITLYPQHGQEVEQLLRRAQLAATWARQHGRRHALYDESLSRDVLDLLELGEAYALALPYRRKNAAPCVAWILLPGDGLRFGETGSQVRAVVAQYWVPLSTDQPAIM